MKERWGRRVHGPPGTRWPGARGEPPLIIPSDHFCVCFDSDTTTQAWGYRMTITAPVCDTAVAELARHTWAEVAAKCSSVQYRDHGVADEERIPMRLAEEALAACHNHVDAAYAWLLTHRDMDMASLLRVVNSARPGLYQDTSGNLEVNLQTAEVRCALVTGPSSMRGSPRCRQVYIRGRTVMPVPPSVVRMPDFEAVFGTASPHCALVAQTEHRRYLQLFQYVSATTEVAGSMTEKVIN